MKWLSVMSGPRSSAVALVLLLKNALERVFVLGSKREDIRHLLLGFFARVGAADSFPLIVAKHVRNGFVMRHPEEAFQHHYDKLHGGVVVVQQQYIAEREVRHLCDLTQRNSLANGFAVYAEYLRAAARNQTHLGDRYVRIHPAHA